MITLDTPIDELVAYAPGTAEVFVRRGMLCVGCDISKFHTIREVAGIYGIDALNLLAELQASSAPPATDPHDAPANPSTQ